MRACETACREANTSDVLALRTGSNVRRGRGRHDRRSRSRHVRVGRVGRRCGVPPSRLRCWLWQEPPRLNQWQAPLELANTAAAAVKTSSLFMNRTSNRRRHIIRRGSGSNNSTPPLRDVQTQRVDFLHNKRCRFRHATGETIAHCTKCMLPRRIGKAVELWQGRSSVRGGVSVDCAARIPDIPVRQGPRAGVLPSVSSPILRTCRICRRR